MLTVNSIIQPIKRNAYNVKPIGYYLKILVNQTNKLNKIYAPLVLYSHWIKMEELHVCHVTHLALIVSLITIHQLLNAEIVSLMLP